MRVSCFKGYSLCIFIVFSCIGILTDCLLFLVIYSFMDICERICREMHTYVSDRDLYALVVSFFNGVLLAWIYDNIRAFRRIVRHKTVAFMSVEDIIYGIYAGCAC